MSRSKTLGRDWRWPRSLVAAVLLWSMCLSAGPILLVSKMNPGHVLSDAAVRQSGILLAAARVVTVVPGIVIGFAHRWRLLAVVAAAGTTELCSWYCVDAGAG